MHVLATVVGLKPVGGAYPPCYFTPTTIHIYRCNREIEKKTQLCVFFQMFNVALIESKMLTG